MGFYEVNMFFMEEIWPYIGTTLIWLWHGGMI